LKIDPNYYDAWNNKGLALGNLQRYKEAIECFDKAIKINASYTILWNAYPWMDFYFVPKN
jgi:superkiller protein 3